MDSLSARQGRPSKQEPRAQAASSAVALASFPPGMRVLLRNCPHGEPGRVLGAARGRVVVEWRDLGTVGKHPPASLFTVVPGRAGAA